MKYFFYVFTALVITLVAVLGFRGHKFSSPPFEIFPDMDRQLKYKTQSSSDFFSDQRSDRPQIPDTIPFDSAVAGGVLKPGDVYLNTGTMGPNWGDGIPLAVNQALLMRGQERYTINCAVCHGATGSGTGIVSQFGLTGVANYHTEAIRNQPDGQIFNTISKGKGRMGPYPHISIQDRWAIVAYVRVLQRSQNAKGSDIPSEFLKEKNSP
jgi:mono/diheme cytochrome c family protein